MIHITIGKCLLLFVSLIMILGLILHKIFPVVCAICIAMTVPMLIVFGIGCWIYARVFTLLKETINESLKEKGMIENHDTAYHQKYTTTWFDERDVKFGLFLGTMTLFLGVFVGDRYYPNPYFYWHNISLIIFGSTFCLFILQAAFMWLIDIKDIKREWQLYGSVKREVFVKNPFRLGQRPAGVRLFIKDIIVIISGVMLTLFVWFFSKNDPSIQTLSLLPSITVIHFFLFCNVFRISRKREILWSIIFIFNIVIGYYWIMILHNPISPFIFWMTILILQLPFTIAVILKEILSKDYHGVGYTTLPWGRKIRQETDLSRVPSTVCPR